MKKSNTWPIVILIVVAITAVIIFHKKRAEQQVATSTAPAIVGCYVAHLSQDVYILKINSEDSENFAGVLSFQNFDKDSSHGTYMGTYHDDILLGEYSFSSEGTDSVRQVIFKKSGENFIEGFGPYDANGDKFLDPNSVTYDPNSTFMPTENCPI